ncbi:MAG TPA: RtcB family protein [Candidatus Nanoarchaeia archaeon]|nr:RtcB family protein [Candidatus Nanoarchaeia archaeon]
MTKPSDIVQKVEENLYEVPMDFQEGMRVSGGVGFDINCGVRILRTDLEIREVRPRIKELMNKLFTAIPSGVGSKSKLRVSDSELDDAFNLGASWAAWAHLHISYTGLRGPWN